MNKIDKFIEFLDNNNLHLCFYLDMKEKYCSMYKNEFKGYIGGFCLAKNDNECNVRYYEDKCIPYDKIHYEQYKYKQEILKQEQFEKQFKKITNFL